MLNRIHFSSFIRECREQKQMSRSQAAEIVSISERELHNIEVGKCVPSLETALNLFCLYGLALGFFFRFYSISSDMRFLCRVHSVELADWGQGNDGGDKIPEEMGK